MKFQSSNTKQIYDLSFESNAIENRATFEPFSNVVNSASLPNKPTIVT